MAQTVGEIQYGDGVHGCTWRTTSGYGYYLRVPGDTTTPWAIGNGPTAEYVRRKLDAAAARYQSEQS